MFHHNQLLKLSEPFNLNSLAALTVYFCLNAVYVCKIIFEASYNVKAGCCSAPVLYLKSQWCFYCGFLVYMLFVIHIFVFIVKVFS